MKLFVKNLTHVDFSLFDTDRGLIGESWQTDVILEGKLNVEGMVCDFSIVKKEIKKWLDQNIDHTLAIPAENSKVHLNLDNPQKHIFEYDKNGSAFLSCSAPKSAFCLLPTSEITPQKVATWCEKNIMELLPADLISVKIIFSPENINGASYQYSHGLKKHDGNCQRIAHGHRSIINIFKDDQPAPDLEKDWALRWNDIYLGTTEDLNNTYSINGKTFKHFKYQASQGDFELIINAKRVYMLSCDTTVELLCDHIAKTIAKENIGHEIEVYAYEGIGKGAISKQKYHSINI